jgi:anthranilate 1,2-dioxygenase small subunit
MTATRHAAIARLLADAAYYLDERRFDDWTALFTEDASYEVIPKENVDQGLPAALMLCEDRDALLDRVDSLRGIIKYNIHSSRHVLSTCRIEGEHDDGASVQTSFTVYQTSEEGVTRLFCCGSYEDEVVFVDGQPKFRKKRVIVDTASIPTLLAVPI